MTETPADEIGVGLDGCGAPTFHLPLVGLARAFAKLTNPEALPAPHRRACRRLLAAVSAEPVLLSGHGRICHSLITTGGGRIFPKNGAEGIYAVGVAGMGLGLAIKIADGNARAYEPVAIEMLSRLGVWPDGVPEGLASFHRATVSNTQRIRVGEVACCL